MEIAHRWFKRELSAYVDGESRGWRLALARGHWVSCQDCQKWAAWASALNKDMSETASVAPFEEAFAKKLGENFGLENQGLSPSPELKGTVPDFPVPNFPVPALAFACLFVAALWGGIFVLSRPQPSNPWQRFVELAPEHSLTRIAGG